MFAGVRNDCTCWHGERGTGNLHGASNHAA